MPAGRQYGTAQFCVVRGSCLTPNLRVSQPADGAEACPPRNRAMGEKLTVLIPCKDERRNIRPCVESARAVADEILVADSGSTDGTQDIVRMLGGCRLIEREFVGYADFKNWAIPQASHPWVLIVDADERVTEALTQEIRRLLQCPRDEIDAYWILRRNFFMGHEIKHCGWNTDDVCRLIRRDTCRYAARLVHEEIDTEPVRTGRLRQRLVHYTVWSYDHYLEKRIRYTKLSAGELGPWRTDGAVGPAVPPDVAVCSALRAAARFLGWPGRPAGVHAHGLFQHVHPAGPPVGNGTRPAATRSGDRTRPAGRLSWHASCWAQERDRSGSRIPGQSLAACVHQTRCLAQSWRNLPACRRDQNTFRGGDNIDRPQPPADNRKMGVRSAGPAGCTPWNFLARTGFSLTAGAWDPNQRPANWLGAVLLSLGPPEL